MILEDDSAENAQTSPPPAEFHRLLDHPQAVVLAERIEDWIVRDVTDADASAELQRVRELATGMLSDLPVSPAH